MVVTVEATHYVHNCYYVNGSSNVDTHTQVKWKINLFVKVLLLPRQSPRVLYYTAHILATSIVGDLIFSFKYLQYIGCLEVNTSMKSLDFDTRSQIAKWVSIFFIFRKKERKNIRLHLLN